MRETWVPSQGWEDPLEEEMATHCSTLAWRIPWKEEPGGLQSMGSQKSQTRSKWLSDHCSEQPHLQMLHGGFSLRVLGGHSSAHCGRYSLASAWSPALQADALTSAPPGKPLYVTLPVFIPSCRSVCVLYGAIFLQPEGHLQYFWKCEPACEEFS